MSSSWRRYLKQAAAAAAARFVSRRRTATEPVDFLLLHDWSGGADRASHLVRALEDNGWRVHQSVLSPPLDALRTRQMLAGPRVGPLRHGYFDRHAAYLAARRRSRVLVTFMDASPLSPYLRHHVNKAGGRVVNVAHGPTVTSEHFTMFDFDYYFVFGPSSVEAILRQATRYGSTRLVETGSYLIPAEDALPPEPDSRTLVYLSSWRHPDVADLLDRNLRLMVTWATSQDRYRLRVKLHPMEDEAMTGAICAGARNVTVLPKQVTMREALAGSSLVVTGWSAATIEAALLNRPCVVVNADPRPDTMGLERVFGPPARSLPEIGACVDTAFARFNASLAATRTFVAWHLARTADSVPFIASCLGSIARGEVRFPYRDVPGTADFFRER